jgi:hypothetical protein
LTETFKQGSAGPGSAVVVGILSKLC